MKITSLYYLMIFALLLTACGIKNNPQSENEVGADEYRAAYVDSLLKSIEFCNKPKNEIRFGNWTDEDWYDNDYFRFLRKYFDDCSKGIVNESTYWLQDYKSLLDNQFFIYDVQEFIGGGLYITLGFLNAPETLYNTVVYSEVDCEKETVTEYSLLGFRKIEETSIFTKEDVLKLIKEHPENKLW